MLKRNIKHLLSKLKAPEPWRYLEKNFEMKLVCEECQFETPILFTIENGLLYCTECKEANFIRQRFLREEEEWNKTVVDKDDSE